MDEGTNLPRPQVSGEEHDAFAASVRAVEILEAFIYRDAIDVFARILGKETELSEQPSEGAEYAAHDAPPFLQRQLGHRNLQVTQADVPQTRVQVIHGAGQQ